LFGAAARLVTLTNLGLLQYMAPTIQFLIGVYLFGEAFTTQRLTGFSLIWLALIIYAAENLLARRRRVLLARRQETAGYGAG
jgi:chloramphenicol-sensitive protein RarD